jgi:hypothetical protein
VLQAEFEQEEDGRWLAEIPALPSVMAYGADVKKPEVRSKSWLCARSQIGLNTASRSPSLAIFLLRRHEPVEVGACETKRQGRGSHRVLEREG